MDISRRVLINETLYITELIRKCRHRCFIANSTSINQVGSSNGVLSSSKRLYVIMMVKVSAFHLAFNKSDQLLHAN